jgi:hypothetical protein
MIPPGIFLMVKAGKMPLVRMIPPPLFPIGVEYHHNWSNEIIPGVFLLLAKRVNRGGIRTPENPQPYSHTQSLKIARTVSENNRYEYIWNHGLNLVLNSLSPQSNEQPRL